MKLIWKMLIFLLTLTAIGMFFKLELPGNPQLVYKIAQAHRMQNRSSLDKKLEDQNLQEKSIEAKNVQYIQYQNAQDKNVQDQNAQDKNVQDQNAQDKNVQYQNAQAKNVQYQNAQAKNVQDQNAQAKNVQDQNAQDKNVQYQNAQAKNVQDQNAQDKNVQDQNAQDKNVQYQNAQAKNVQDQNAQAKNVQDQNAQDKNIQDQNAQDKNVQCQNAQAKNIQDQNAQDKNVQYQNAQDKNVQEHNAQDKNVQYQNAQDKNVQYQNAEAKNVQDQNAQDKNIQDQNAQDKNVQYQNAQDKNVQDQNAQAKNVQDQNAQAKNVQDQNAQDENVKYQNAQAKNLQYQNAQAKNVKEKTQCGCQKCFSKDDKFLMSCFNPSIEPFLSASSRLSLDAFMWWKSLQSAKCDFKYYKTAVANLFKIFPPVPDLGKPSPGKCRTCAVVGNSVNLRGSGYGSLIDGHDIVIRMNGGPTAGYEIDVGTKTTHRVLYPESAVDLDNSTHLVVFVFKIQDLEWSTKALTTGYYVKSYRKVKPKINANKDLVMVVNPAFMKYVHETWMKKSGTYPSTGFMTLILSLHVCDEVHVFGFGADSNGNWSHYFEVLKKKNYRTGPHSGTNEYKILKRLAREKTVTLYKGS